MELGHAISSGALEAHDNNAISIKFASLKERLDTHTHQIDERLTALQSAIDANSIALSLLVKDAQARQYERQQQQQASEPHSVAAAAPYDA